MLQPKQVEDSIVYTNNRVTKLAIENLKRSRFTVLGDDGKLSWSEALLKCISGELSVCIFHSPQTRDVLLGALIESFSDGRMTDWEGKKISWPNGGRIPYVIFAAKSISSEIVKSLRP